MDTRTPFSAVIFDLYNTVVPGGGRDQRDAVSYAMAADLGLNPARFAEAMRASFDVRVRGMLGGLETTIRALAVGLGVEPAAEAVHQAAERRIELVRRLLEPAPMVLEQLDRLRAEGYRIGLISDCSEETPRLWPGTPLAERIDAAVFSCTAQARKPDPALYRMAAAELGVEPEECVYVGDGASDELGGAASVGMTAIQLCQDSMSRLDRSEHVALYGARPWHGPMIDGLEQVRGALATGGRPHVSLQPLAAVPAGIAGIADRYTDPLWEITVHLSDLERALLRSAPLRRLHFIAHAGASSITTTQTYSRLEHSLGVFALTAHFHPGHELLRAAALLHDVGHLPLSHTLEGISGLNHHDLGARIIGDGPVADVLTAHGMEPSTVSDLLSGAGPTPWNPPRGVLGVDHLDSFVRSARSGARLSAPPRGLLARLEVVDGAVSTDRETAHTLVELVCGEALLHTSWENIAPSAVLQELVRVLLDQGRVKPAQLAGMTDGQLWAALEAEPLTRIAAQDLRFALPATCTSIAPDGPATTDGQEFALRKLYTSAPLINGLPIEAGAPELARVITDLSALPTHYRVRRAA